MNTKNILDRIFRNKKQEVEERKSLYPVKLLERSPFFATKPVSLAGYIQREDKSGIIAEFKKHSPSKGSINGTSKVTEVSRGYMQAGASGLSILTDTSFFGGDLTELKDTRNENYCPILQKDFILDTYQVIEAKSFGADAILLIARMLSKEELALLSEFAHSLGLEVFFEIHEIQELDKLNQHIDLIGINNRDLGTFRVDIETSSSILDKVPKDYITVAESGIDAPETAYRLQNEGFDGLLIGEVFMKHYNPAGACLNFIKSLKKIKQNHHQSIKV
jgi:indole-3-glycerol phosphate synthase